MLAVAACSTEKETEKPVVKPDNPQPEQPSETPLTFTATLQQFTEAQIGTKTAMSGPLSAKWQPGDRIAVFCGKSTSQYSYVTSAGDGTFTGNGKKASLYRAVYPSGMTTGFSLGKSESVPDTLSIHFPCEQTAVNGSFDPTATAAVCTSADEKLAFQNVGGLVRFTLNGTGITKATLRTPDGTRFGGVAKVIMDSGNDPEIASYVDKKSAYSVWLRPSNGTFESGGTYYFSIPPQELSHGVKIIFTNSEGKEAIWSDTTPIKVERSTIADLGTIDTGSLLWENVAVLEFLKESGTTFLWPFSEPASNPFPTGYKDARQVNYMKVRTPMTLKGVGDFVLYLDYDGSKYADNEAALGSSYVAPTNHTGFRFGSSAGSYLEVPGREGLAVYKITITAATNGEFQSDGKTAKTSDLGKLRITDSKGNDVEGGEMSTATLAKGAELTWKFRGTNGMPYRIVSGGGETNILELRVFYMSSTDPLVFSAQGVTMQGVRVDPFDLTQATVSGSFDALPFFDATKFTCGFEYKLKTATTWSQAVCSSPAENFSCTLSGLDPDKEYECRAFVTCGSTTLRSSRAITFRTSFLEEAEDPAADVVKSYDYSVLKGMGHPRIMMRKGDFEKLAERVKDKASWPMLAKLNDLIISYASGETTSSSAITYTLDASNKRLLSVSRLVVKRLLFCSYAYRMTGEQIYLNKVKETLDIVCRQFPDWHPSHYLDTGEMALGVAIAYDWLYYDLDYDTRLAVRKALSNYGVNTALNDKSGKNATQTTKNNWNSVCNAGITAAAIATYPQDKANAAQVIENALVSNAVAVEQMYSPDGNYGEGYGYWEYGTSYQICLNEMLIKAFGNDHGLSAINGFMKTGEFMLFMGSACGGNFSFADGGSAKESMNIPMWWFAAKSGNAALLANEIRLLNDGKYSANRLLPVIPGMIMDFSFDASNLPFPSSNMWVGEGLVPVAMVHTGWKFNASDYYFGFKGGAANGPHGHMDVGSFVYESQGVRWSDDLQRPDYAQAENLTAAAGGSYWTMSQKSLRWEFFRMNNLAHSTLTFENNDGSVSKTHDTDHDVTGKATIIERYTDASSLGVKMDLTPVFKGQAASVKRTVRLMGDDLVITDEVKALNGTDAKMQWRMLTPATVQKGSDGETLTRSGKGLSLKAVPSSSSVAVNYTTWEPKRPSDWTPKRTEALWNGDNSGYTIAGYTATVPKGTTVTFVTTLSKR